VQGFETNLSPRRHEGTKKTFVIRSTSGSWGRYALLAGETMWRVPSPIKGWGEVRVSEVPRIGNAFTLAMI
jgi:hypothetical protein